MNKLTQQQQLDNLVIKALTKLVRAEKGVDDYTYSDVESALLRITNPAEAGLCPGVPATQMRLL